MTSRDTIGVGVVCASVQAKRESSMRLRRALCVVGTWLIGATAAHAQTAPPFPITFQRAVQHAVEHYPAIQASMARVSAQETGVDLARTAYLPRIDTTFQLNRATRNNVTGLLLPGAPVHPISGPVSDITSFSGIWGGAGAVVMTWEAMDFGLRGATVDAARAQVARARAGAELTRLEIGVNTADAFLRLAAAQETVRAARANVERQSVFANAVSVRVTNQLRPGADDSRAQAELAVARIQLIQAEQAEQIARANLAQWLGASPAEVQIDAARVLEAAPAPSPSAGAAAHPLAETQMAAVESSRALQNALGHSFAPRLNLQTAYSIRGSGALASGGARGLAIDTPNWAAGVTATFPLFDWFSIRERSRLEAHNERAEQATYDRVVRELAARSAQARAEMDGARRIAENTPIQLSAARTLEQQARARYDAGLADILEVADAQRLLLQAEVGDAVARLGVWRALLADAAARGDLTDLVK
jgi:outer membrane protein TolC